MANNENNPDLSKTNGAVNSEQTMQNPQVARVAAKLPPLWKNKIEIWFIQVESNFQLAGISCDVTKYNHVVAAIDPETLAAVSDILMSPPKEKRYDTLKQRLIQEYSESETKKVRQLVSELQLGDGKPSHLLRKMQDLAGTSFKDENFLKTLFLQRLPADVQTILSVSTENVNNLAKMADKILEVRNECSGHAVLAMSQRAVSKDAEDINALRSEIAELSKQVERLSRSHDRGYMDRPVQRPFQRSNSRGFRRNSRSNDRTKYDGKCYYHFKFGNRAFKCTPPCNFNSSAQHSEISEN